MTRGESFVLLAALAAWTLCPQVGCLGMEIVRDGKAVATIVVAGERPTNVPEGKRSPRRKAANLTGDARAAGVLADWINKITDVQLPVAESAPTGSPAIYVGVAAMQAGLNLDDIVSTSSEGLRVVVKGDRALLAGQNSDATLRAVCRLLEKLGCRYFMDREIGEVFPRAKSLSVSDLEMTEKPGFAMRKIWGSRWSGDTLWKIWNGAGGIGMSTGHSWAKYIPASKYYAQHPEYFSLRNGERREGEWLCTSNPDVPKVFAQAVIEAIRRGDTHPSISPPDGRAYCQCDACRAKDDSAYLEPSSATPVMSDRYVEFLDTVAKQVATIYPDATLNFYAYADYTQPPIHHGAVSKNLCVWLAPIRYCRYHAILSDCGYRKNLGNVIDGWSKVVSKLGYREYNYNLAEALTPIPKMSVWKRDIPYLKRRGFVGVNFESLPSWCLYGPHLYLSIRLAYNPDADADAIMDDYYRLFFGPEAGPFMKEYWQTLDETVANMQHHTGSFYALQYIFTPDTLRKCRDLLDKAAVAAAKDARYLARVKMCDAGFVNAEQYITVLNDMNTGEWGRAKTVYDELIQHCAMLVKEGFASEYTRSYCERFVGPAVKDGFAITSSPNKMLLQLPDMWRFTYDASDEGLKKGYPQANFNDASWRNVKTYTATLLQQGIPEQQTTMWYRTHFNLPAKSDRLAMWFAEVDGDATVYINGQEVGKLEKRRKPFAVDITRAAKVGDNVVAVRVDHSQTTELYLGGIIRPVIVVETKVR